MVKIECSERNQQINYAPIYAHHPRSVFRQNFRAFLQSAFFKRCVEYYNGAGRFNRGFQLTHEFHSWVAPALGKKLAVLWLGSGLANDVQRKLKRDLFV